MVARGDEAGGNRRVGGDGERRKSGREAASTVTIIPFDGRRKVSSAVAVGTAGHTREGGGSADWMIRKRAQQAGWGGAEREEGTHVMSTLVSVQQELDFTNRC